MISYGFVDNVSVMRHVFYVILVFKVRIMIVMKFISIIQHLEVVVTVAMSGLGIRMDFVISMEIY
eukprot:gene21217-27482_t